MSRSTRVANPLTMTRRRAVQAGIAGAAMATVPARIGFASQVATPRPRAALPWANAIAHAAIGLIHVP